MDAAISYPGTSSARQVLSAARLVVLNEARRNKVPPSAEELIGLIDAVAREQDRNAFARLFGYFAPRVKSFLMRSGLEDSAAEEVAQEVMIAVWRKASYFDPAKAGASTWIFTIARNLKIDRLRRTRSRTADNVLDPSEEPEISPSGEQIILVAEREDGVRKALESLPGDQAAIVRLSFFAEKPHAAIAQELGIPLGTVKSRARLALNRLRTLLDGDI